MLPGSGAWAADALLEEVTIVGSRADARQLPGSGAVVDAKQMTIEVAGDINQLMTTVPGVYIREEDGLGLRPNIGIRGATSARSGKVTLLEDGVMIAPATPAFCCRPCSAAATASRISTALPMTRATRSGTMC